MISIDKFISPMRSTAAPTGQSVKRLTLNRTQLHSSNPAAVMPLNRTHVFISCVQSSSERVWGCCPAFRLYVCNTFLFIVMIIYLHLFSGAWYIQTKLQLQLHHQMYNNKFSRSRSIRHFFIFIMSNKNNSIPEKSKNIFFFHISFQYLFYL